MATLRRFWKIPHAILLICVLFYQYECAFSGPAVSHVRQVSKDFKRHIRRPRGRERTRLPLSPSVRQRSIEGAAGRPQLTSDVRGPSGTKPSCKSKTTSQDLKAAKNRLMRLCDNVVAFPYIVCRISRKDSHKYRMMSGSFGVGVVAHLINDPGHYDVEIHANAKVTSPLEAPRLTVATGPDTLISPSVKGVIPVFIKTGRFFRLEKQLKLCPINAPSMFCLEKRRARALSGLNLAPTIYDIVNVRTKNSVISEDYYVMEYLDGDNLHRIANIIVEDMEAMWKSKIVKLLYIGHESNHRQDTQLFPHLKDISYNTMIRLRSLLHIVTSAYSMANRLWLQSMRHCDLHGGNILILKKTVELHTSEFDALASEGKAVSRDLHGHSLYDMRSLKQTLSQLGFQKLTFYVLEPQYTRVIDLSYTIRIDLLTENANGKENLWTPCRRFSHHRNEDIIELARVVRMVSKQAQRLADVYKRLWQNEEDLQHVEANVYADVKALLEPHITELLKVVKSTSRRILTTNGSWKDCIANQEMYVKALKGTAKEKWSDLRQEFHLKFHPPKCSVSTEEKALQQGSATVNALLKALSKIHSELSSPNRQRQ